MQFIDEVEIEIQAGKGGDGCAAFRREKYQPFGGPAGGDGGDGGDIVFVADSRLTTLIDLKYQRHLEAKNGEHGRGRDQYGRGAPTLSVRVPLGTQVYDKEDGSLVHDFAIDGEEVVVARGGRGGRGNLHFATPFDRAPRRADPGGLGDHRKLRMELKLLADIGIVGYPNVGKSTFIAAASRARPKIADYPFTTLVPNLGVVSLGEGRSFVIADIPGIIEGASEGAGLGLRFLKHIERTRVLLHIVSPDPSPGRAPLHDFEVLMNELKSFDETLATRPMIVALGKRDLAEARDGQKEFIAELATRGHQVMLMSAATGEGVQDVLVALERTLRAAQAEAASAAEEQSA